MEEITVDLALYGTLARVGNGLHVATLKVTLPKKSTIGDLLAKYKIDPAEKGYLFVNAVLYDMPGLNASKDEELHDKDHMGVFSTTYMWPYQYRDGVPMTESLKKALREQDSVMHNIYGTQDKK